MRRRQKQILAFFVSLAMVGSATIPAYAEQENIASEATMKETTETKSEEAISEDSVGSLEKKEGEAEGKEVQVPEEKKQASEGKVQEEAKEKEETENKENSRKEAKNESKEKEVAEGSVEKEENTYSIVDLSKLKSGFKETEEEGIEEAPVAETASLFGYSGFRSVGYVPRTTNPGTGGRFYGYDNPFPAKGINCTWYAWGRAYELLGYSPNLSRGDARTWWQYNINTNAFPRGYEPRVGAIACWSYGTLGHVAVVEKIENGIVYTSSSSIGYDPEHPIPWKKGAYPFRYDVMENIKGFQGYIYVYSPPAPPKPDRLPLPAGGSDDDIEDGEYLITSTLAEGRCLAYGGNGQSGQNVFIRDYRTWGEAPYYWRLERQPDDSFIIRSKAGTVLDVNGGPGAAGNGPNIQVWNQIGTNANQRFYIVKQGGAYEFIPQCSGLRMDVDNAGTADGTNVRQYEPNGSYAQRFKLFKYYKPKVNEKSAPEVKSKSYILRSKLAPNKAVAVATGNATQLGSNVHLWEYNKDNIYSAIIWNLEKQGDGSFLVKNQYNNQYLDVVADSLYDQVNILTWEKHGKPSEQWYVVANGDGTYRFVNKGSGKVVDITGGLTANGTNVQQYLWHGHDAQRFYLDRYPAAVYYNVIFKGMIGETLSTQNVEKGENASYPSAPLVQGYEFTGWDKDARNVQGNITITAQYRKKAQTGGNSGSSSSGSSGSSSGGGSSSSGGGGGSSSGSSKPSGGGSGFSGGGSSFSGSSSGSGSSGGGGGGGSSSGGFGKPSVSGGNVGQVLGVERSLAGGQWMQDGTGWWYKKADGSYPKNNWGNEDYNGKTYWYYFLDSGYMATGWIELNGSKYYLFPTSDGWKGRMVTGWQWIDGYCYYLEEGGANQGRLYRNEQKDGYQLDSEGRWTVNGKPVKR
ncbi:glucan-binding YG repeat protein [Oribacterium sinus]|uniref:Glucan-binding YG repeat protein n=1 Tax=Oribacterium sinus TaxID=237576 RepID=A0A7W9SGK5_9FIRM|nr:RICIN domain-containing protein [Oribacterium sinus]MBB6041804.1 glucan-binding YG repeat protein [Oribacterium sinus]